MKGTLFDFGKIMDPGKWDLTVWYRVRKKRNTRVRKRGTLGLENITLGVREKNE